MIGLVFAAALAASAAPRYDRAYVEAHGWVLRALQREGEQQQCASMAPTDTTFDRANSGKIHIVSAAFVESSDGQTFSYIFWIEDHGTHIVYRSDFILHNCILAEEQSDARYFRDGLVWNQARNRLNELIQNVLSQ